MLKKIIVNLALITAFSSMTSSTTVFADSTSTDMSQNASLGSDSTTESTSESSLSTEATITSPEQTIESSQSDQEGTTTSPSPLYNNEDELRKQFETDSRNQVLSFEEYKSFIETLASLSPSPSQYTAPEVRSLFKASNQRDQIVAEAKKHIGKPYTQNYPDRLGPNKFDCSGLSRYVFLQVTGKNIGDWTVPQEKSGTKVNISKANISQLEPGDLLFWGSSGATYHVAIYIGNEQYIHAPNFDTNVEQSPIWWSAFPPSFALKMNLGNSNPQGNPINDGSYVTITQKGYNLFSSFNWAKKNTSDKLLTNTYQAKYRYNHSNGDTYYSLYDSKGTWQGYINAKAVKKVDGKQGLWLYNNEFVTVTKKDSTIWGNINDFSAKKGNTNSLYQKTYHAQGKYNHFSGEVFYSLYDNKNVWIGYVNKKDVAKADGKQGIWMRNNEYVTITKKDYTIWGNINDFSAKKGSTNSLYQKTYHAQGRYNHFSEEVYYSLYDNTQKWIGYVNKTGVSIKH
ncbi:C40 family peptidase [Enterococcus silesiacus]|nr:C40 family peptidase [Enterococcus silesiacus]